MLPIYSHPACELHSQGGGHPERPERLQAITEALEPLEDHLDHRQPARVDHDLLHTTHDPDHIDALLALRGEHFVIDADTQVGPATIEAAERAAGCAVEAVEAIMSGESERAFALARPPGHHAESDRAMGFCYFNNIALAAQRALQLGCARVLIVDWDVHHGNGSQEIFEARDDVLVFNTHQWPLFPGSGAVQDCGRGPGLGFTVNVPMPGGTEDGHLLAVYEQLLAPIARDYRPDLILVSAGFDAHARDPLGGMRLSTEGFAQLCQFVLSLAEELTGGKLMLNLEGGYDLDALADSVVACCKVLLGQEPRAKIERKESPALRQAIAAQGRHWGLI